MFKKFFLVFLFFFFSFLGIGETYLVADFNLKNSDNFKISFSTSSEQGKEYHPSVPGESSEQGKEYHPSVPGESSNGVVLKDQKELGNLQIIVGVLIGVLLILFLIFLSFKITCILIKRYFKNKNWLKFMLTPLFLILLILLLQYIVIKISGYPISAFFVLLRWLLSVAFLLSLISLPINIIIGLIVWKKNK